MEKHEIHSKSYVFILHKWHSFEAVVHMHQQISAPMCDVMQDYIIKNQNSLFQCSEWTGSSRDYSAWAALPIQPFHLSGLLEASCQRGKITICKNKIFRKTNRLIFKFLKAFVLKSFSESQVKQSQNRFECGNQIRTLMPTVLVTYWPEPVSEQSQG